MSEQEFEPWIGKRRPRQARREQKYLNAVLASAARSGFPKPRSGPRFEGSRIGRGSVAARMLAIGDRYAGLRARRAIVKTRLIRLAALTPISNTSSATESVATASEADFIPPVRTRLTGGRSSDVARAIATNSGSSSRPKTAPNMTI